MRRAAARAVKQAIQEHGNDNRHPEHGAATIMGHTVTSHMPMQLIIKQGALIANKH